MKNRQGLAGQKSSLFFEYLRVFQEAQPKYFLFENVGGMKQEALQLTETKQVVLATYAMAAEALDIKTLSTLVMITPKTDIIQSVGRILRVKHENPIVVDIVDSHDLFQKQWAQRRRFYKKCNYRIRQIGSRDYKGMQIDWDQDKTWKRVFEPIHNTTAASLVQDDDDEPPINALAGNCAINIADLDFGKIQLYGGTYTFWYESSQLAARQRSDQNKKTDEKRKELEEFIRRFSANVAKSKQATSRQKMLDKLQVEDIKPSSRKYPFINFKPEREAGDQLLSVENLSATTEEGVPLFTNLSFTVNKGDKVAFLAKDSLAITALFDILMGEGKATSGEFKWGVTTTQTYLPNDNANYFKDDSMNLVDWLRQYSVEKDESFIRGFLGRMLFSGEEALKKCTVISGGEKQRCMFSRMMLSGANVLLFDEPTNHLDLESITALNNGMVEFPGTMLFTCHDHQLTNTVANRVIELGSKSYLDKLMTYDEFITDPAVKAQRAAL
jgi:ABC-type cobalamin/Fe3+-siderophores transport system ATPase subunit/site-specific DNA-cytosine methylase